LTEVRENLRGIQSLASEHGIIAGLHIHSGEYMTATGGMVSRILEGMDADCVGAYIDPGHMVLEGGRSGWKLGMDLLRDVTVMVAVKDFGLERDPNTKKKWLLRHMPLSEGMVPWLEVLGYLRDISFDGPVSLHSEYELPVQGVIAQTRRDLEYLRLAISEIWGRE
jgi:sugar phosphate isomerase/epimerase